jgi:hypothetical protein
MSSCKVLVILVKLQSHLNFIHRWNTQISIFMKIRPVGAGLLHADGQRDMTKLIVTFRNFANPPKNWTPKAPSIPPCTATTHIPCILVFWIRITTPCAVRKARSIRYCRFLLLRYHDSWGSLCLIYSLPMVTTVTTGYQDYRFSAVALLSLPLHKIARRSRFYYRL